jgi:hypothetical protein
LIDVQLKLVPVCKRNYFKNLLFLAGVLRSLCAMVLLHAGISNMKYRYGCNGQDTDDMG